jgi:hypothetical protein
VLLAAQLLRRRASPAVSSAVPRRWVLGIVSFTALCSAAMSASQFAMSCDAGAVLDPIVRWAVYCCRIQLLGLAGLMAQQACPDRSARTTVLAQQALHRKLLLAAAAIPAAVEALELALRLHAVPLPSFLDDDPWSGAGCDEHTLARGTMASTFGTVARAVLNALCTLFIVVCLVLVRFKPARHDGTSRADSSRSGSSASPRASAGPALQQPLLAAPEPSVAPGDAAGSRTGSSSGGSDTANAACESSSGSPHHPTPQLLPPVAVVAGAAEKERSLFGEEKQQLCDTLLALRLRLSLALLCSIVTMTFSFSGQVVDLVVWADSSTPMPSIDESGGTMSSAATSLEVLLIERVTLSLYGLVLLLLFGRAPGWLAQLGCSPAARPLPLLPEIFSAFPRHFADVGRVQSCGANLCDAAPSGGDGCQDRGCD